MIYNDNDASMAMPGGQSNYRHHNFYIVTSRQRYRNIMIVTSRHHHTRNNVIIASHPRHHNFGAIIRVQRCVSAKLKYQEGNAYDIQNMVQA